MASSSKNHYQIVQSQARKLHSSLERVLTLSARLLLLRARTSCKAPHQETPGMRALVNETTKFVVATQALQGWLAEAQSVLLLELEAARARQGAQGTNNSTEAQRQVDEPKRKVQPHKAIAVAPTGKQAALPIASVKGDQGNAIELDSDSDDEKPLAVVVVASSNSPSSKANPNQTTIDLTYSPAATPAATGNSAAPLQPTTTTAPATTTEHAGQAQQWSDPAALIASLTGATSSSSTSAAAASTRTPPTGSTPMDVAPVSAGVDLPNFDGPALAWDAFDISTLDLSTFDTSSAGASNSIAAPTSTSTATALGTATGTGTGELLDSSAFGSGGAFEAFGSFVNLTPTTPGGSAVQMEQGHFGAQPDNADFDFEFDSLLQASGSGHKAIDQKEVS